MEVALLDECVMEGVINIIKYCEKFYLFKKKFNHKIIF